MLDIPNEADWLPKMEGWKSRMKIQAPHRRSGSMSVRNKLVSSLADTRTTNWMLWDDNLLLIYFMSCWTEKDKPDSTWVIIVPIFWHFWLVVYYTALKWSGQKLPRFPKVDWKGLAYFRIRGWIYHPGPITIVFGLILSTAARQITLMAYSVDNGYYDKHRYTFYANIFL